MSSFKNLWIVDNFYQTLLFYPMPTMLVGTLAPDRGTLLGAYSLCFPYYIAGKSYYAMLLECRNSSNTALTTIAHQAKTMNLPRVDGKIVIDAKILEIINDKQNAEKAK